MGLVLGMVLGITEWFKSTPPVAVESNPPVAAEVIVPNPPGAIGVLVTPPPPKVHKPMASVTIILALGALLIIPLALYVLTTGLEQAQSRASADNEQARLRDEREHPTPLIGVTVQIPTNSGPAASFVIKSFGCGTESVEATQTERLHRAARFCAVDLTVTNLGSQAMVFGPGQIEGIGRDEYTGGNFIKAAVDASIIANKDPDIFRDGIQPGKSISVRALLTVPVPLSVEYVWVHATTHDVGAAVDVRKSSAHEIVIVPPVSQQPVR